MTDITELETRLSAALDRIGQGLDRRDEAAVAETDDSETRELAEKLEAQQAANALLEAQMKSISDAPDDRLAAFEARLEAQTAQMADLDGQLQRLRRSNTDLRGVVARLREAMAADLADPDLINATMLAELDALRATREADVAELDAVLAELKPLVEESV